MQEDPSDPTQESKAQSRSTVGLTSKVVKGSFWTLLGHVAPLLFSFFATPFVIRMLGTDAFGVFILVGLIPTYFNFADFGMGMASTKFGSEAYGSGDAAREARIVRTAAVIALVPSLPIAVFLVAFSGWITSFFNIPEDLRPAAILALKIAAGTFVLNFLNAIFNSPQLARLRMYMNTLITAVPRIAGVIATPIVIYFGWGIVGAVSVLFAASLLTLMCHLYFSRRLLPELVGMSIERTALRPMLQFGGALVIATVAAVFLVNVEKLILARVTSVETLAHYSVAFTLANMVTLFTAAMSQSLVPAFSQLARPDKLDQLNQLYSRSIRINIFVLLPGLVILAIIAKPFFTVWAGEEFGRESPGPFYVLLLGLFFNLCCYIPWAIILSQGRTDFFAKFYWIQLFPYIGLTAALAYNFGAVGAAAAWAARVIAESFTFFRYAGRISSVRFSFSTYTWPLVSGIGVLLPPLLIALAVDNRSPWLLLLTPVSLIIYVVLIWKTVVAPDEKVWLEQLMAGVYSKIFRAA